MMAFMLSPIALEALLARRSVEEEGRLHLYNGIYLPLDAAITSRLPPAPHTHRGQQSPRPSIPHSFFSASLPSPFGLRSSALRPHFLHSSLSSPFGLPSSPSLPLGLKWRIIRNGFARLSPLLACYVPPLDWKGDPSSSFSASLSADRNGWWKEGKRNVPGALFLSAKTVVHRRCKRRRSVASAVAFTPPQTYLR